MQSSEQHSLSSFRMMAKIVNKTLVFVLFCCSPTFATTDAWTKVKTHEDIAEPKGGNRDARQLE